MFIKEIRSLFTSKSIFQASMIGFATLVGSFFSYLLQFVLGRLLEVEKYGEFNTLLSFSLLVTIPATFFGLPLIKWVAQEKASNHLPRISAMFWIATAVSLLFGIVASLVSFFLGPLITQMFKFSSVSYINYFSLFLITSFIGIVPNSFLQGLLEYKKYSIQIILGSFIRLLFPTFFVLMGMSIEGIYLGFFFYSIVVFSFAIFSLREFIFYKLDLLVSDLDSFIRPVIKVGFLAVLLNGLMLAFINLDMVLVKRMFSPQEAGFYSGIVTMGKILLFGTSSVTIVMFPKISNMVASGIPYARTVVKLFFLQLILLTFGIILYTFVPTILINVFFGERFSYASNYLPLFSVFISLYVLLNFVMQLSIAVENNIAILSLIPGVLLQVLLIVMFSDNLYQVILSGIAGCSVALLPSLISTFLKIANKPLAR